MPENPQKAGNLAVREDGLFVIVLGNGEVVGVRVSDIGYHVVDPTADPTPSGEQLYFWRIEDLIKYLYYEAGLHMEYRQDEGDEEES